MTSEMRKDRSGADFARNNQSEQEKKTSDTCWPDEGDRDTLERGSDSSQET